MPWITISTSHRCRIHHSPSCAMMMSSVIYRTSSVMVQSKKFSSISNVTSHLTNWIRPMLTWRMLCNILYPRRDFITSIIRPHWSRNAWITWMILHASYRRCIWSMLISSHHSYRRSSPTIGYTWYVTFKIWRRSTCHRHRHQLHSFNSRNRCAIWKNNSLHYISWWITFTSCHFQVPWTLPHRMISAAYGPVVDTRRIRVSYQCSTRRRPPPGHRWT